MNEVIKLINEHRTIREFKTDKISDKDKEILFNSLMRTATSNGLQQSSIIWVRDQKLKDAISVVCNQDYVSRLPELLIFIVDNYRNYRIIEDQGMNLDKKSDVDIFFQGYTDACLMAQNANLIIESLGMGAVFLGSILNNSKKIIEILKMPKFTFPVLGLGFGYPDQKPQLKPRMKKELRIFENTYKKFENYMEEIRDYDDQMTTYYDLRDPEKPVENFSIQVLEKFKKPLADRVKLLEFAKDNGYKL